GTSALGFESDLYDLGPGTEVRAFRDQASATRAIGPRRSDRDPVTARERPRLIGAAGGGLREAREGQDRDRAAGPEAENGMRRRRRARRRRQAKSLGVARREHG